MTGMGNVHPHGAGNAHQVYAVVLVEALIFRGNGAFGNVGAHVFKVDGVAVLKVEFRQQGGAVVGVHLGFLCVVVCGSVVVVGQILQPRCAYRHYSDAASYE